QRMDRLADDRYEAQGDEARTSVQKGKIDDQWLTQVEQAFHAAHLEEFGHKFENGTVEVINIRVDASAVMDELPTPLPNTTGGLETALVETRPVTFDVEGKPTTVNTGFYEREKLGVGTECVGPVIIEQYDSTVVVPPGFQRVVDEEENLAITYASEVETEEKLATPDPMRVDGGALNSAAKEMASVLFRMAYSSIIRESEDLGAGLFDRDGNVLAESD